MPRETTDAPGVMKKTKPSLARTMVTSLRNRKWRPGERQVSVTPDGVMTVASYNVHKCVGTDGRFDPERIIDLHALLMFRALYARDPDPGDLPADSPFRRLLRPG